MFDIEISKIFSIDYEGQRQAEKLFQILVSVFAAIAFVWGFYVQQFSQTLMVLGGGVGLCALLILPPWPFWNKHPVKWQKVKQVQPDQATTGTQQQPETKKKN